MKCKKLNSYATNQIMIYVWVLVSALIFVPLAISFIFGLGGALLVLFGKGIHTETDPMVIYMVYCGWFEIIGFITYFIYKFVRFIRDNLEDCEETK